MLNLKPKVSLEAGAKILLEDMNYWQDTPIWKKILLLKQPKNVLNF